MFLESLNAREVRKGHIEVVCGSMFSGKTEELIRRLKRAKIAKQKVEIYKPRIDTRYDEVNVVSHDSNSILLSIAEYVTKVHAICMKCGELANYSHRTVAGKSRILLGEQESYVPLCRHCFNQERKENH